MDFPPASLVTPQFAGEVELTFRPSPEDPSIVRVKAKCVRADGQTSGRITLAMRVSA